MKDRALLNFDKVRREAQQVLAKALRSFPYSYTDIVEQVCHGL